MMFIRRTGEALTLSEAGDEPRRRLGDLPDPPQVEALEGSTNLRDLPSRAGERLTFIEVLEDRRLDVESDLVSGAGYLGDDWDSKILRVSRTVSGAGSSFSSTPYSRPLDRLLLKGLRRLARMAEEP